jgi:DNA-binding MurR/RpiR family transcriptional regulator
MPDPAAFEPPAPPAGARLHLDQTPLERRIGERLPQLTPAQERLSTYVLSRIEEAVFLSSTQLAAKVGASDATVSRYAAALGFDSFDGFRRALQDHYHAKMNLRRRLEDKLGRTTAEDDLYVAVTATEIEYLHRSLQEIRAVDIRRAAEAIAGGRKTFIKAERPAWCIMDLLDFRLTRFRLDVVPIRETGRYLLDRAQFFSEGDALILLAFQRFSPDLEHVLDLAHARRVRVIVITDLSLIPAVSGEEVVLSAMRGPTGLSHSLIVPLAIVQALVLSVATSLGGPGYAALEELDRLRSRYE